MAEYCVPKLARTEIAGDADAPLHLLTDEQLNERIVQNAAALGIKIDLSALH